MLAQVKIHAIDSIWTLPPGCYREVTCLYSDHYIVQVPLYNNMNNSFDVRTWLQHSGDYSGDYIPITILKMAITVLTHLQYNEYH